MSHSHGLLPQLPLPAYLWALQMDFIAPQQALQCIRQRCSAAQHRGKCSAWRLSRLHAGLGSFRLRAWALNIVSCWLGVWHQCCDLQHCFCLAAGVGDLMVVGQRLTGRLVPCRAVR